MLPGNRCASRALVIISRRPSSSSLRINTGKLHPHLSIRRCIIDATGTIDNIPFVVLQTIFLHLKRDAKRSHNDLLACSLVDKSWHYAAIPYLYAIIALNMDQAERFMRCFNVEKYAKFVLSLTIRIESGKPALFRGREVHDLTLPAIVDDRLIWLVLIMKEMTSLVFFSLYTQPLSHLLPRREIIHGFLHVLPMTLAGLEIDVWNVEDLEDIQKPGRPHLCDTIHMVLHRLEYVRLRMAHMCSAMLGVHDGYHHHLDTTKTDTLGPVPLLNLRAMIINCGFLNHDLVRRCSHWPKARMVSSLSYTAENTAWTSLTKAMEQVVEKGWPREQYRLQGQKKKKEKPPLWSFPPWLRDPDNVQITITSPIPSGPFDRGIWTTYIRADMVKKESWAIPQCDTDPKGPFSRAIRLPAGDERMVTEATGETLIEGEAGNWCDMLNGARLPAEILDLPLRLDSRMSAVAQMCGERSWPQYQTPRTYRQQHSEASSPHWQNEENTGMKLMKAEKRVGKDEYLSMEPLVEITPEGWERYDQGRLLKRIGEPLP